MMKYKNILKKFYKSQDIRIFKQYHNKKFDKINYEWTKESLKQGYIYNFTWMGIPIIKYPSDLMVLQEIIFQVKPDLIIETGVAHGGSLCFLASMQKIYNPKARTIGVEIDFRKHNEINCSKIFKQLNIKVLKNSSTDEKVINQLKKLSKNKKVLVILDSDHSHKHVLNELNLYSNLVSKNSYLVCTDTIIEEMPKGFFLKDWQTKRASKRNFDKGNSPLTAIKSFIMNNNNFKLVNKWHYKAMVTESPFGFLKKIR